MAFDVVSAVEGDATEVANVHLQAMDDNALLHAQFPNLESLMFLRGWLERDTVQHVKDDSKGILIAKNREDNDTASFVKWNIHGGRETEVEESAQEEEDWPHSCRQEYLDSYGDLTARVRKQVMGEHPYYRELQLSAMVTGEDCGVIGNCFANAINRRDISLHKPKGMAVVLESTMNAVTFYLKLGFGIAQGLDMMLPRKGSDQPTELYEERCMVWTSSDGECR